MELVRFSFGMWDTHEKESAMSQRPGARQVSGLRRDENEDNNLASQCRSEHSSGDVERGVVTCLTELGMSAGTEDIGLIWRSKYPR